MDVKNLNIVLTGPESTAKSSVAKYLAEKFKANYIPEFARVYLEERKGVYDKSVLSNLWKLHLKDQGKHISAKGLNILDTDLENYIIWFQYKYAEVPKELMEHFQNHAQDFYLLMYPDTLWEEDPLRENPSNRLELFEAYKALLEANKLSYAIVKGMGNERFKNAELALLNFLKP